MANRNFPSKGVYSAHVMPVEIDGKIFFGTASVASFTGGFVKSVTRLAAGQYRIQLMDNYNRVFNFGSTVIPPLTGSAVAATALVAGTAYQITSVGTTDFSLIGAPAGVSQVPGLAFVATGAGTGSGTATAVSAAGVAMQLIGDPNLSVNPSIPNFPAPGAVIQIQAASGGSVIDPPAGAVAFFRVLLSNSSVLQPNE